MTKEQIIEIANQHVDAHAREYFLADLRETHGRSYKDYDTAESYEIFKSGYFHALVYAMNAGWSPR